MTIKAYKGFNKDMTCKDFQYKEGETYELPEGEKAKLCENGFHACEAPIDCLRYYAPAQSVYHEVELDATDEKSANDSKRVGKLIKIGAKIDIAHMVKAQFEYVKKNCTNSEQGGYRSALTGGDGSALTGGDGSALTGGDRSALTGGGWSVLRGGKNSKFKGGIGTVFAVEVWKNGEFKGIRTKVVDGKLIKPDTWYRFDGKKWVDVEDEHR